MPDFVLGQIVGCRSIRFSPPKCCEVGTVLGEITSQKFQFEVVQDVYCSKANAFDISFPVTLTCGEDIINSEIGSLDLEDYIAVDCLKEDANQIQDRTAIMWDNYAKAVSVAYFDYKTEVSS